MAGILFGVVADNEDPDGLGRVQVRLPDYSGDVTLPWIRVVSPFASNDLGVFCLPEVEDHVVVLQGAGGVAGMVVIGSLFHGKRKPPPLDGQSPPKPVQRGMLTPGGSEILVDDTSGSEKISIKTKEGKVMVVLDHAEAQLLGTAEKGIALSSSSGPVTVDGTKIEVNGSDAVTIKVGGAAKVSIEGGNVEIKGSQGVKISGAKVEIG